MNTYNWTPKDDLDLQKQATYNRQQWTFQKQPSNIAASHWALIQSYFSMKGWHLRWSNTCSVIKLTSHTPTSAGQGQPSFPFPLSTNVNSSEKAAISYQFPPEIKHKNMLFAIAQHLWTLSALTPLLAEQKGFCRCLPKTKPEILV